MSEGSKPAETNSIDLTNADARDVPDWVAQPSPLDRPLDLDWGEESNEWFHHLFAALQEIVKTESWNSRQADANALVPAWHIVYRVRGTTLRSWLVIVPTDRDLTVAVAGIGQASDEEIAPWIAAVTRATSRTGNAHHLHEWTAAIGPRPTRIGGGSSGALSTDTSVGPLRLRQASVVHTERMPPLPPMLSGWQVNWSWPIAVEGKARGFSWSTATVAANRQLSRLCGLLSVAWDVCMTVRAAPQPGLRGESIIPREEPVEPSAPIAPPRMPVGTPDWIDQAWVLVEDDAVVARALTAYHEGMQLLEEHPSMALVAFVACVEILGEKLHEMTKCEKCEMQLGAGKRYRAALRLVRQGEDLRGLVAAYEPRSKTAHAGQLFGGEELFGAVGSEFGLALSPSFEFKWFLLRRLRSAAADLLRLAFTDGIRAAPQTESA